MPRYNVPHNFVIMSQCAIKIRIYKYSAYYGFQSLDACLTACLTACLIACLPFSIRKESVPLSAQFVVRNFGSSSVDTGAIGGKVNKFSSGSDYFSGIISVAVIISVALFQWQ